MEARRKALIVDPDARTRERLRRGLRRRGFEVISTASRAEASDVLDGGEAHPRPHKPRPIVLRAGGSMGWEPHATPFLPISTPIPAPVQPSAREDLQILLDAPTDFEARYRVVFASLEKEPAERRCIIEA